MRDYVIASVRPWMVFRSGGGAGTGGEGREAEPGEGRGPRASPSAPCCVPCLGPASSPGPGTPCAPGVRGSSSPPHPPPPLPATAGPEGTGLERDRFQSPSGSFGCPCSWFLFGKSCRFRKVSGHELPLHLTLTCSFEGDSHRRIVLYGRA